MSSELSDLTSEGYLYGPGVELQVCDSCDYEYPADEMKLYVTGELRNKKRPPRRGVVVYRMENNDVAEGKICRFCRQNGPVDTPQPTVEVQDESFTLTITQRIAFISVAVAVSICLMFVFIITTIM